MRTKPQAKKGGLLGRGASYLSEHLGDFIRLYVDVPFHNTPFSRMLFCTFGDVRQAQMTMIGVEAAYRAPACTPTTPSRGVQHLYRLGGHAPGRRPCHGVVESCK